MSKISLDDHYNLMRVFISDVSKYVDLHPIYDGVGDTNIESIKKPLYAMLSVLSEKHRLAQDKHNLSKRLRELKPK